VVVILMTMEKGYLHISEKGSLQHESSRFDYYISTTKYFRGKVTTGPCNMTVKKQSKAIPLTGCGDLQGCEMLRIPHCLESIKTEHRNCLNLEPTLVLALTKIHHRIESLAC
jgi:hypothetical protein